MYIYMYFVLLTCTVCYYMYCVLLHVLCVNYNHVPCVIYMYPVILGPLNQSQN